MCDLRIPSSVRQSSGLFSTDRLRDYARIQRKTRMRADVRHQSYQICTIVCPTGDRKCWKTCSWEPMILTHVLARLSFACFAICSCCERAAILEASGGSNNQYPQPEQNFHLNTNGPIRSTGTYNFRLLCRPWIATTSNFRDVKAGFIELARRHHAYLYPSSLPFSFTSLKIPKKIPLKLIWEAKQFEHTIISTLFPVLGKERGSGVSTSVRDLHPWLRVLTPIYRS